MKKRTILTLTLVGLLGTFGLSAGEVVAVDGLNYEVDAEAKTASVVAGEYTGDVVIPNSIIVDEAEYAVKSIGNKAFNYSGVTSVTIPNSVDSIAAAAFMSCKNLVEIHLGTGLKVVDRGAFGGCTKLEKVVIDDLAVWCGIDFFDESANPTRYAKHLYKGEEEVTALVIPDTVTEIGDYAFTYCTSIASVDFGKGVTKIGNNSFYYCTGLTSLVLPENLTELPLSAFAACNALQSVELNDNLEIIGEKAFAGCFELLSVKIPDSVKKIGVEAFDNCMAMTELTLGSGIESIGKGAFKSCIALGERKDVWGKVNIKNLDTWCRIKFEDLQSNPVEYADRLFVNGEELTELNYPAGIGMVNDYAFNSFKNLKKVTLPDDVTTIGSFAFYKNEALTTVSLGAGMETVGDKAFYGCKSLADIQIGENVKEIKNYAFWSTALKELVLPEGLTTIGSNAFEKCEELTSVTLPKTLSSVGSYVFQNCTKLESIEFPVLLSEIPMSVCSKCTALKSLKVANPEAKIHSWAFKDCGALEEAWINTKTMSYAGFPKTATLYVPYGSTEEWAATYPENTLKQTGYVEIGERGYVTYYINAGYVMPEGLTGYVITDVTADKAIVGNPLYMSGSNVPKGTPLLIKGEDVSFDWFVVDTENASAFEGNSILMGVDKDTAVTKEDGKEYYRLGYDEEGVRYGFMRILDNGGFLAKANTAYLVVDAEKASDDGYLLENMSGVESISVESACTIKGIFRLDGTRVYADSIEELPAGFYIVDGKKVIVNK